MMLLRFQYGLKDVFTVMEKFGLTSKISPINWYIIIIILTHSYSMGYDLHVHFSVSSFVQFDSSSYHLQRNGKRTLRFCCVVWSISDTPQQKHQEFVQEHLLEDYHDANTHIHCCGLPLNHFLGTEYEGYYLYHFANTHLSLQLLASIRHVLSTISNR